MKEKFKDWLMANKKDIKILVIGGIIVGIFFSLTSLSVLGLISGFWGGILLTAIYVNAYRFWRK